MEVSYKAMALVVGRVGKVLPLMHRLNRRCAAMVAEFVGNRCSLCDSGTAVGVKHKTGMWQFWCLDCALSLLPDETSINIHAKRGSIVANHSFASTDQYWSDPDPESGALEFLEDSSIELATSELDDGG